MNDYNSGTVATGLNKVDTASMPPLDSSSFEIMPKVQHQGLILEENQMASSGIRGSDSTIKAIEISQKIHIDQQDLAQ